MLQESSLSINDTNALKGIAIILMLIHHLFWKQNGLFDDFLLYGDHYLVNEIGKFSKFCVVFFVFLSGYELTVQAEQKEGIGELKTFYLGKHSMNIFLFHTFIFYFWFQDFVYSSRIPIIIFLTLLAICLPISIVLEWIKKYTIYKL